MNLTFLYSSAFVRDWNRHRLSDLDLQALENEIDKAANSAPVVKGSGGLRKLRFAPPSWHTGKSGAMRVGFAYFRVQSAVFVMALLAKNEAATFTKAELAAIAAELKIAEERFR